MNPNLKRILLIVLFLVICALIGLGIYLMFKATDPNRPPISPSTGATAPSQLPQAGERPSSALNGATNALPSTELPAAGIISAPENPTYYIPEATTMVSSDYATFPTVSSNGDIRYHNIIDGKFYRVAPDGSTKELSDQIFYNVKKITWANSADKAVLEYPDSSKIIYNFDTHSQVSLPKHWENFSFSPDGSELAAKSIGLAPENRWIVVTKDDGTGTKLVEPIGNNADKIMVNWSPSRQTVAFAQTGQPQGAERREVLFMGLHGENFKSTIVEGLNFQPRWSPTGKKLLYSVDSARSNFKPELWIVNSYGDDIGSDRTALRVNTWANKCAFDNDDALFCAVPRDLPEGAGMSPAIADTVNDDLYKIDLRTGLRTNIPLGGDYTVGSISFNKITNKIIFTDKHANGIFKVNL